LHPLRSCCADVHHPGLDGAAQRVAVPLPTRATALASAFVGSQLTDSLGEVLEFDRLEIATDMEHSMAGQHTTRRAEALRNYILAAIPGWVAGIIIAVLLYRTAALPFWAGVFVVAAWVLTDLAMFPRMRRYYASERAARRIVGEEGVAISELAPRGFARVHGELWQAQVIAGSAAVREGDGVRVREIHGLQLVVERSPAPADR
jgi:membrane protein implicated in regulation of membrane protease activity